MEPANLNSPAPDDARLEALLRRTAPAALPDDGFSTRVLAALPAAAARSAVWPRVIVCAVGAAAGGGFALWSRPSWTELCARGEELVRTLNQAAPALADPLLAGALAVTVLSLLVAFRTERREKLPA